MYAYPHIHHGTWVLNVNALYESGNPHSKHVLTLTWEDIGGVIHYKITSDDVLNYLSSGKEDSLGDLFSRLSDAGRKIYG